MKLRPVLRSLWQSLPALILILAACTGTPVPTTPPPASAPTITATLPEPQFPDPPTLPVEDTPTPTPTGISPVPSPTYIPFAKNWLMDLIYDKTTSDARFEYDETLAGKATFTLDDNGIISGQGSGAYTQGLKSKIAVVDCGFPLTSGTTWKLTGTAGEKDAVPAFHMQVAITFQSMLATSIHCASKAAGIDISIPVSGSGDVLTQRASSFPWNDFIINPTLGLYSVPITGQGIDWKTTGGGELTIRIAAVTGSQ